MRAEHGAGGGHHLWPRIVETKFMRAEILLQQQALAAEEALTLHHDEPTGAGVFGLG